MKTAYALPPHDWTPSFPAQLTPQNVLYYAGPGGTVLARETPDSAAGATRQYAFYGLAKFTAAKPAYTATVMIDTPITSDAAGDIYFGFFAGATNPGGLTSGIARIGADGTGTWISASDAAGDPTMTGVATNCAPAVSADQSTIYIAVTNGFGGDLVGLNATTLHPLYNAPLIDPSSGDAAWISENSSAAPTVGPDGDVFYGVLEEPFPDHNDRGWLLHFDATLATVKTPGSFGWDDTVSVVPAGAVPSYKGTSTYLLMSKYNNYLDIGSGNGRNRIAILDPTAGGPDPILKDVTVMQAVMTELGPTPFPGAPKGAVYEWCINSAAVDAATNSVFANSEDGHLYRWDSEDPEDLAKPAAERAAAGGVHADRGRAGRDGVCDQQRDVLCDRRGGAVMTGCCLSSRDVGTC